MLKMTTQEHEVAYQELIKFLEAKAGHLDAIEMLAVAANMVGKLIAFQDKHRYTPAQVMEIIGMNIEHGNKQAIAAARALKETPQ